MRLPIVIGRELVFKALADPTRRELLDEVFSCTLTSG